MKIYIEPKFTNQISEDYEPVKSKNNLKLIMLAIVFILACLLRIIMVDDLPNTNVNEYAFTLPLTQFGCLHYYMLEGETFSNWRIEQPTIIHIAKNSSVSGIVMFNVCNWF